MQSSIEEAVKLLESFEGKEVNFYCTGKITSFRCFNLFQCWSEELVSGEYLIFSNEASEDRVSVLMDEIHSVKIDEVKREVVLVLDSLGLMQIWLDLAS